MPYFRFSLSQSSLVVAAVLSLSPLVFGDPPMSAGPWKYPVSQTGDTIEDYHGEKVADPYRWLEDLDSDETKEWVENQNKVTFAYLDNLPARAKIEARLTELWNYERFGLPRKRGGKYFYTRNDGLQNQSVLYVADSPDAAPRELLDPNKLAADGTVALSGTSISKDGRLLAYGLAASGSDWNEWRVRDVASGKDLDDHIKWVKFSSASWLPDGSGFFYSRYDEPPPGQAFVKANYYQKLFFHKIGDPQEKDQLIYERKDHKEWGFGGGVTDDGKFLIINVWRGSEPKNQIFYKRLGDPSANVIELVTGFDAEYSFVDNDGDTFWVSTDSEAAKRRLIAIDVAKPERENWKTVIPESDATLTDVSVVGEVFVADYLRDAHSQVLLFDLQGKKLREVALPGIGSAGGFGGERGDSETFYSFTNYITPGTIFRYDTATGKTSVFRAPKVAFDPSQFESRQVFYTSRDGTRIPMTITSKKGLQLDGNNPTILYGYGGFNNALTPGFSPALVTWFEMGGVYAVPNLRGGGEYGREWHEAGMRNKKQNVFDDFIAAAEYLIAQKITRPEKLAIRGGSNGGLLVGAVMTQRPELFGAAVPAVGVMDMLRFHKFTIGWAWVGEYGSSDDAEHFKFLKAYSPLHNIKPKMSYPPTLIVTGDHDDRVVPSHSFKFAATLQQAQAADRPALIRIETKAGHGAGKPTSKLIREAADVYAFLADALQVK